MLALPRPQGTRIVRSPRRAHAIPARGGGFVLRALRSCCPGVHGGLWVSRASGEVCYEIDCQQGPTAIGREWNHGAILPGSCTSMRKDSRSCVLGKFLGYVRAWWVGEWCKRNGRSRGFANGSVRQGPCAGSAVEPCKALILQANTACNLSVPAATTCPRYPTRAECIALMVDIASLMVHIASIDQCWTSTRLNSAAMGEAGYPADQHSC